MFRKVLDQGFGSDYEYQKARSSSKENLHAAYNISAAIADLSAKCSKISLPLITFIARPLCSLKNDSDSDRHATLITGRL